MITILGKKFTILNTYLSRIPIGKNKSEGKERTKNEFTVGLHKTTM